MNLFPIWNHLGGLYTETGKFDQAVNIYKEYIKEKEKPGGEFFMPDVISGYAKIFFKRNEFEKAAKLLGFTELFSKQSKRKTINNERMKDFS